MQLNLELGKRLKERGMNTAAMNRAQLLAEAIRCAWRLGVTHGQVSADMIAAEFIRRGLDFAALGNAAGSIFKGADWEPCGFTQSTRPARHAGMIRVWKLKDRA